MGRVRSAALSALLAFSAAGGTSLAAARNVPPASWHDVKCVRYEKAWAGALARRGTTGLSQDFLERHDAFLASNCSARADVCPRSTAELALANVMVVLAMNAGTASTFPPFACPR